MIAAADKTTLQAFGTSQGKTLDTTDPANQKAKLGRTMAALAASVLALDTALGGDLPNFGAPVANLTDLAAIGATARQDKQARIVEDDGQGRRSLYVFEAAPAAGLVADGLDVVAPGAGTGLWFRAYELAAGTIPIVNATGGALAKGKAVCLVGWDATKKRFKVDLATNADAAKAAVGVLAANLADGGSAALQSGFALAAADSGLDTSGGAAGDPVFLGTAGALVLAAPTGAAFTQEIGKVGTVANPGAVQVQIQAPRPLLLTATAGDIQPVGTQAAGNSTKAAPANHVHELPAGHVAGVKQAMEAVLAPTAAGADAVASAVGEVNTAFASKYTVPGNRLKVGSYLRIVAGGKVTAGGGAINLRLTLKIGGVVIGVQTTAVNPATGDHWRINSDVIFSAIGAGGKFNASTFSMVGSQFDNATNQESALDTTADRDVTVEVNWAADAGAAESVRLDLLAVQVIN